ncbi:MAG: hypothetical protein GY816_07735 [Cytophagales bacterium]|nr:hypothetical protein [Cytophagales bacterium]
MSYGSRSVYLRKCKQVDLLPIADRFILNDLILMHKIIYNLIPIKLPNYLSFFSGNSRLRSSHLDSLSLIHNIATLSVAGTHLNKSFFFRTHTIWNDLPLEIRQISGTSAFKNELRKHLWKLVIKEIHEDDDWAGEEEEASFGLEGG